MRRDVTAELLDWCVRADRKPMVLRGARQVGKTWLVRALAASSFENLVEINFDEIPDRGAYFESAGPTEAIRLIEADLGTRIVPGKTLLFLDEIQAAPQVFPRLRYFYEKLPELHVIAAGSLLEFLLAEHSFSMPVGRIEYLHLGPMTFEEFLSARAEDQLRAFLAGLEPDAAVPDPLHARLLRLMRDFLVVGGMPAAVKAFADTGDLSLTFRQQQSVMQGYLDDFGKYRGRIRVEVLRRVFQRAPTILGRKVKYVHIDREQKSATVSRCLDLLEKARVLQRVRHSAGNGVPLAAEVKERDFKLVFLDVGLAAAGLGVRLSDLHLAESLMAVNNGALCEQAIGQHLLYAHECYIQPELFYWNREKRNSSAEVDYLFADGPHVVPIEVKAGSTGSLRSLHLFAAEKGCDLAVRFNTDVPSLCRAQASIPGGKTKEFTLLSLPLYMVGQLLRLIRACRA